MEYETYEKLLSRVETMEKDFKSWTEKGNKSACKRLRKECSDLAKDFMALRRELLKESKE